MTRFKYLVLFIWLCAHAHAQEHVFAGAIDNKHALHMFLTTANGKAEATYFYDRFGLPIPLTGAQTANKLVIENDNERFSGVFDGKFYTGAWRDKRRQRETPFVLELAASDWKALTGQFRCTASRSGAGGGATAIVELRIKAGNVSAFSIESHVMPHTHTCNPDHSKLRQTARGNTLTLTGIADPDVPCPINLRRAGPYIHFANSGGGCLCGARATIPDVLLDMRNNTCRIAQ